MKKIKYIKHWNKSYNKLLLFIFFNYFSKEVRKCKDGFLIRSLFEVNKLKDEVIFASIPFKDFKVFFKVNYILYFLFKGLDFNNVVSKPDFHSSLDFNINLLIDNFIPWSISKIASKFFIQQLSKLRNKQLQESWLIYNSDFIIDILKINELRWVRFLNYTNITGFSIGIKGRAADLRWVSLRFISFGFLPKTNHFIKEGRLISFNLSFLTTKWGSTSCRMFFVYKNTVC